jgi:threonine dehydratase
MAAWGAEIVVHGRDFQETREHMLDLAANRGLVPVPSFHRDLVAGVATYAAELHEQAPELDVVYVPVGQGSGICANIVVRDLLGRSRTEVVGVVAEGAPAHALSFSAGHPVATPTADTFVDGVATRTPDADAVEVMVRGPAGAIGLAGLLADASRAPNSVAATIMTGGNCDAHLIQRVVASD